MLFRPPERFSLSTASSLDGSLVRLVVLLPLGLAPHVVAAGHDDLQVDWVLHDPLNRLRTSGPWVRMNSKSFGCAHDHRSRLRTSGLRVMTVSKSIGRSHDRLHRLPNCGGLKCGEIKWGGLDCGALSRGGPSAGAISQWAQSAGASSAGLPRGSLRFCACLALDHTTWSIVLLCRQNAASNEAPA